MLNTSLSKEERRDGIRIPRLYATVRTSEGSYPRMSGMRMPSKGVEKTFFYTLNFNFRITELPNFSIQMKEPVVAL